MNQVLVTIQAPHFCASLVLDRGGNVKETAPILRWCRRKPWPWLYDYFLGKGWGVSLQTDPSDPETPDS